MMIRTCRCAVRWRSDNQGGVPKIVTCASAWRADPERSPCDTVAREISDGRRGNEDRPDEGISPSLEERSSISEGTSYQRVGRQGALCAIKLLKSIDDDETD